MVRVHQRRHPDLVPGGNVTRHRADGSGALVYFRSTPPHGEQPTPPHPRRSPLRRFDPRPRTGSDCNSFSGFVGVGVSIHAPARGATDQHLSLLAPSCCFDPRPRRGSDVVVAQLMATSAMFRSTPRHGERRLHDRHRCRWTPVSIHAPAGGATTLRARTSRCCPRFDPRPRRGSDREALAITKI